MLACLAIFFPEVLTLGAIEKSRSRSIESLPATLNIVRSLHANDLCMNSEMAIAGKFHSVSVVSEFKAR